VLVVRAGLRFPLTCCFLLTVFVFAFLDEVLRFAALRAVFFVRFVTEEVPDAPIRKSSRFAPALIFSCIHRGTAPRPAQTLARLSGSRYFGEILRPLRLPTLGVFAVEGRAAPNSSRCNWSLNSDVFWLRTRPTSSRRVSSASILIPARLEGRPLGIDISNDVRNRERTHRLYFWLGIASPKVKENDSCWLGVSFLKLSRGGLPT
jgi:hypothetical protein